MEVPQEAPNPSCEAVTECSPRRKPWVKGLRFNQPRTMKFIEQIKDGGTGWRLDVKRAWNNTKKVRFDQTVGCRGPPA
jgi:hypothetical protein